MPSIYGYMTIKINCREGNSPYSDCDQCPIHKPIKITGCCDMNICNLIDKIEDS